jgi:ABC-type sugar transport system, ATPase component
MSSVLKMQNIQKSFGTVKALEDGKLTLERGEIHA